MHIYERSSALSVQIQISYVEVAPGLYERELRFLQDDEWALRGDDVLWRRSKLGLHYTPAQREQVARWMDDNKPRDDAHATRH